MAKETSKHFQRRHPFNHATICLNNLFMISKLYRCLSTRVVITAVCLLSAKQSVAQVSPTITLNDGTSLPAQHVSISERQLTAELSDQSRSWPLEEISSLTWDRPVTAGDNSGFMIQLVDGSVIFSESFAVKDALATIKKQNNHNWQIETRDIQWVRHLPNVDEKGTLQDPAWSELLTQPVEKGDALVVIRDQSLTFLEGVVGDVTAQSVSFKYGSRQAEVTWDRIAGIRFYHASGRELPDARCTVKTLELDQINVSELTLNAPKLPGDGLESGDSKANGQQGATNSVPNSPVDSPSAQLITPSGVSITISVAQLLSIDWAGTSVSWMDEFLPIQVKKIPYLDDPKIGPLLEKLKQPTFSKTRYGNPLSLMVENPETKSKQIKEYEHGIQIKGSARLIWLLEGKHKRLFGSVGFDPRANSNGHVTVIISGDGRSLFEQTLEKRNNDLVELNIDVSNVRRLTLEIDGGKNTAGDDINFCDLRVVK